MPRGQSFGVCAGLVLEFGDLKFYLGVPSGLGLLCKIEYPFVPQTSNTYNLYVTQVAGASRSLP